MIHALIMAGGGGTRLWPLSTPERSKQYLRLFSKRTMLEATVDRLSDIIQEDNQWIVTLEAQYKNIVKEDINFSQNNMIFEPAGRNTAPCIGLAMMSIFERDKEAIVIILPADHYIADTTSFQNDLKLAVEAAKNSESIVTIGIEPTRPETGYGYIEVSKDQISERVFSVSSFKEKPDEKKAQEFLDTGRYLWNSGMFIVSAKRMLEDINSYLPDLYTNLCEIEKLRLNPDKKLQYKEKYESLESISIDYGIIEKAENVMVVRSSFGWSDLGGYEEMYRIAEKDENDCNVHGNVFLQDTKNSYIKSDVEIPVAVIGMENVVVVVHEEGILVCDKDQAQKVKSVSNWLK
jgi:mannose-1-phosphate guanylyltransferase